ncbi:LPS assembly lipoprotein LptE [Thalassobaculum sp.]|uniref:LPS assembly lipoprotein LptE n=1 Tax=Thalassobaculum sp. TaxID=2022740 RepID=UPI0032EBC8E6
MIDRRSLLLLPLGLAACGFEPLYGNRKGGGAMAMPEMAQISISPIADRAGQMLRNELRDRLVPTGVPRQARWRLDVALNETTSDLVILRDATATFAKYVGDARWVLVDLSTDAPVTKGRSRRIASYSISSSEFASLQAEEDARRRVVTAVAEDIVLRLGLYFQRTDG